jgi:hypothetical protein
MKYIFIIFLIFSFNSKASVVTVTYDVELKTKDNIVLDNSVFGEISISYIVNSVHHDSESYVYFNGGYSYSPELFSVNINSWTSSFDNIISSFYTHQTAGIDFYRQTNSIFASKSSFYNSSQISTSVERIGYTVENPFLYSLRISAGRIYPPGEKSPYVGDSLEESFSVSKDTKIIFDITMNLSSVIMYDSNYYYGVREIKGAWLGNAFIKSVVNSSEDPAIVPLPGTLILFGTGLFCFMKFRLVRSFRDSNPPWL